MPDISSAPADVWSRTVRGGVWLLAAVAAGLVAWTVTAQTRREHALERGARETARSQAVEAARAVDTVLQRFIPVARTLADDLSAGRVTPADLMPRLVAGVKADDDIFEVGVAFVPFASSPAVRLYSPHAVRKGDGIDAVPSEARDDYTAENWYTEGLKGPAWSEPYYSDATNLLAGYNVPFFRPGDAAKTPIGVVHVNFSLDDIHTLVSNVSLGETGYGFMLSRKGVYLSHPDESYVRERRSVFDVARERGMAARIPIYQRALGGEAAETLTVSGATGQQVWLVLEPVKTAGWVFAVDFFTDEISQDARGIRRGFMRIAFAALLLAFAVTLLAVRVERGGHTVLWVSTIALAVLLLAGIAAMWGLTMRHPDRNGEASVHILDKASMHKFIAAHLEDVPGDPPVQIPVGVLVRTVRFVTASDVVVSGTIWERIPVASRATVKPGLDLPDAETFDLKDPVTTEQNGVDVTSWTFRATLREPSVWSQKYPFDRALIRMRVLPKPSGAPLVLVPSLESYELLMPPALPGIDQTMVLPGWTLDHSYFSYLPQKTQTSDAAPVSLDHRLPYDLAFNLVTEREFLDPFVSSVLPIIVIACLLFGLLIVGSKKSQLVSATGFKATDVLRASVSLLFPALVAQVNLRSKIGGNEIIYIEYFYFILYLAILGVSANALTFTLGARGVSQVRDNLIPKLLFWPAVLGACFAVTIVFLY